MLFNKRKKKRSSIPETNHAKNMIPLPNIGGPRNYSSSSSDGGMSEKKNGEERISILTRERIRNEQTDQVSQITCPEESTISLHEYSTQSSIRTNSNNTMVTDTNNVNAGTDQYYEDILAQPLPLRSKIMTSMVGLFVAVGGFLFGYDTGLINSVSEMPMFIHKMTSRSDSLSNGQLSIVVSFLSLGTFIGALSAPFIADRYGRKPTIIVSNIILFIIGTSLQVMAKDLAMLVVGRVVSGIGIGLISAVVPLYQAEAAEKNLRGAIISSYQWTITIGLLVSNAIAQSTGSRHDLSSYRIPLSLQFIWSIFLAGGMFFLPESPRYFIIKDDIQHAAKSLSFLRGIPIDDPRLLEELVEIKATYDYESSFGKTTVWDCFISSESRPKQVLRIFTGIAIQVFQQFSGINFIFYYGIRFFRTAGIAHPFTISLITYAVNVAFNVPGMFFIEYFGRRNVLLYGGVIMTISNFIVASVGITINIKISVYVVIAFICTFIAGFSATWGGVVWVISAELFPLGVRSKSTAICTAANWMSNFICSLITPYVVDAHADKSTSIFFIWGTVNAVGVVIVYFTVYETSGLRLEEITELYEKSKNCFDSIRYNKILRDRPILKSVQPAVDLLNDLQRLEQEEQTAITGQVPRASNIAVADDSAMEMSDPIDSGNPTSNRISSDHSVGEAEFFMSKVVPRQGFISHGSESVIEPIVEGSSDGKEEYKHINNQIMDLGNGLRLNTYKRHPPSISSESSFEYDDDLDHSHEDGGIFTYGSSSLVSKNKDKFKENVIQLAQSSSHTTSNSSTNYSSFLNVMQSHPYDNNVPEDSNEEGGNSSAPSYNGVDWGQYLRRPSETSSFNFNPNTNTAYPYSQFHTTPNMHIGMDLPSNPTSSHDNHAEEEENGDSTTFDFPNSHNPAN